MTPIGALQIFEEITTQCDFFNVFETVLYSEILPTATWVDLTDYNGFLVEQRNPEAIKEKIRTFINNPGLCQQMGGNAFSTALGYDIRKIAELFGGLIEK